MRISDDELMAFLDGELPEDRIAAIEMALADDPALVARAEQLAASDQAVRRAFDAVLAEPVPAALLAAAAIAPDSNNVAAPAVIDLAAARTAREAAAAAPAPRSRFWIPTTIAASLALGLGMGALLPRTGGDAPMILADADGTRAGPALAAALSSARSGVDMPLPGGTVRGVISVRASDGRLCRQFSLRQAKASLAALACRSGSEWQIEVASNAPVARNDYALAAGPSEAAISAALDAIGAGAPLDAEAERKALQSR